MLALTVAYSDRDAPFGTVGVLARKPLCATRSHRDTGLVFCALVKRVGCSRRRGPCLIMIEMNEVLRNVSQFVHPEIELCRVDVSTHGARIGGIILYRMIAIGCLRSNPSMGLGQDSMARFFRSSLRT